MKQEHEYAQVLRWVADGDDIQFQTDSGKWFYEIPDNVIWLINNGLPVSRFRLAPRTITVNGREVPEPVREAQKTCTPYYVPRLDSAGLVVESYWIGSGFDDLMLQRGLIHLTKEAAITHAKAMLGLEE